MLRDDCLSGVTLRTLSANGVVEQRRNAETLGMLEDACALQGPTAPCLRMALPLQEGWQPLRGQLECTQRTSMD